MAGKYSSPAPAARPTPRSDWPDARSRALVLALVRSSPNAALQLSAWLQSQEYHDEGLPYHNLSARAINEFAETLVELPSSAPRPPLATRQRTRGAVAQEDELDIFY